VKIQGNNFHLELFDPFLSLHDIFPKKKHSTFFIPLLLPKFFTFQRGYRILILTINIKTTFFCFQKGFC